MLENSLLNFIMLSILWVWLYSFILVLSVDCSLNLFCQSFSIILKKSVIWSVEQNEMILPEKIDGFEEAVAMETT